MIIRRETLNAALPATTHDDTRYFLSKVQITPSGEVRATDGHIAIIAKDRHRLPDEDFPIVPGAPFHGDPSSPVLVDATTIKRLTAGTPKGKRMPIPVLCGIQISRNGSDHTFTLAATDLKAPVVATVETVNGENFPTLERVFPAADKVGTVPMVLSVEVLENLLKCAKAVQGAKRFQAIRFEVPIGRRDRFIADGKLGMVSSAIRVTVEGEETEVVAVVMPCRV